MLRRAPRLTVKDLPPPDLANTTDAKKFIKKKPVGDGVVNQITSGKTVLGVESENKKKGENEKKTLNINLKI